MPWGRKDSQAAGGRKEWLEMKPLQVHLATDKIHFSAFTRCCWLQHLNSRLTTVTTVLVRLHNLICPYPARERIKTNHQTTCFSRVRFFTNMSWHAAQ